MDTPAVDEKFLKALAMAVVDHPAGTFKDIAQAAGVSKATLNRFCGTRSNLIDILLDHGSKVMYRIIQEADLHEAPPLQALQKLIDDHLTHREMLMFLIFQWKPDSLDAGADADRWQACLDALDAFFLRGQREGVFRIDMSAAVLCEVFGSLIFGLVDAERRGRVARASLSGVLMQTFLRGAQAD